MPNRSLLVAPLLAVCLAVGGAAQVGGEEAEGGKPRKVTLRVWVEKASADVWIETQGMEQGAAAGLVELVPAAVGTDLTRCDWELHASGEGEAGGRCRNLLRPERDVASVRLRLGDMVREIHRRGGGRVVVDLLLQSSTLETPPGWVADEEEEWRGKRIWFLSRGEGQLPPEVPLRAVRPTPASRVLAPLLVVLFVPGLIAYAVRLRAGSARADEKVNWLVWMNWILLGSWLYWISSLQAPELVSLAARAGVATRESMPAFVAVAGVVVYALPPLLAIAACFTAMAPLLSASREHFRGLLTRQLTAEAAIIVPLGIFLVGMGLGEEELRLTRFDGLLSLALAYLVYRALAWVTWKQTYVLTEPVESGELWERAKTLAEKAGVKLARLSLRRTKIPEEANAFAVSGDAVVLTESLVRGLTPREVDAVLAHELGHHKEGHLGLGVSQVLLVGCLLFGWPALSWAVRSAGAPLWIESLPLVPLVIVLGQGWFSQRREYAADARAVEITGDAEGKIAALARLAHLSRIPPRDGGVMGSILSHPSMEARVLRLGRRYGVSDERVLEVLRNPDAAYEGKPEMDRTPAAGPGHEPVFTDRARVTYAEQLRWGIPLAGLGSLTAAALLAPAPDDPLQFFAGVVLGTMGAIWCTMRTEIVLGTLFVSRMRRELGRRLEASEEALFVGLHPGTGVRFTEGFADWDFGFLSLEEDWLHYRGEKTSFAIPRQMLGEIRAVRGRLDWLIERRVEVRFRGGAFTFNSNFANPTRGETQREAEWLRRWVSEQESPVPLGAAPAGPPSLPELPGMEVSRGQMVWGLAVSTLRLLLGGVVLAALLQGTSLWISILPLPAACVGFAMGLPGALWPVSRPKEEEREWVSGAPYSPESASRLP